MQRFCSIVSQLPQLFPRLEFKRAVKKHRSDHAAKGFTSRGQLVAMLFCQFGRAHSLREICGGSAGCNGKLNLEITDSERQARWNQWRFLDLTLSRTAVMCSSLTGGTVHAAESMSTRHVITIKLPAMWPQSLIERLLGARLETGPNDRSHPRCTTRAARNEMRSAGKPVSK